MSTTTDFAAAVRAADAECATLGYRPTRWPAMVGRWGVVGAATRLVIAGEIQSGFKRLAREGRLDLSVECLMLRPQFTQLFKRDVLAAAQWRLDQT